MYKGNFNPNGYRSARINWVLDADIQGIFDIIVRE
jgi:hypothetical protein